VVTAGKRVQGMGAGRISSRGDSRGFSQNFFQRRPKVVKFVYYPSKLKKQPFFASNFKTPTAPPSDAHGAGED